jgi:hypothetical protein
MRLLQPHFRRSSGGNENGTNNNGNGNRQPEVRVSQQEIELTMEPIVVGIEMGPEITINASGTRSISGNLPDNYLQVINKNIYFLGWL